MHPVLRSAGLALLSAAALAQDRGVGDVLAAGPSPSSRQGAAPTFNADVAPIVWARCAGCHRPGEPTPFALLEYTDVARRARTIRRVVESGRMPPWLPAPARHAFAGERRLAASERDTLLAWIAAGVPEGAPDELPERPRWTRGWRLGAPDLVVTAGRAIEVPAAGPDVFQNLVLGVPGDGVRHVRAVEIRPGSPAAHHAILHLDSTPGSRARAAAAGSDGPPGFPGMDMSPSEPPDGHFVGWTPGGSPYVAPEGAPFRLPPRADLVLQLHLTPTGKPERVLPRIGLWLDPEPPRRRPHTIVLFREDIDIPAGAAEHAITDEYELPVAVELLGVYPHAHDLGRSVRAWARPPGGDELELLSIDDWDFDWQEDYRYARPVPLPAGTRLVMEWVYDNSAANPENPHDPPRRVRFGPGSSDEMGTVTFTVMPRETDDLTLLEEARWRHVLRKKPRDAHAHNALAAGLAARGQHEEALEHLVLALRIDPRLADAHSNLGFARLATGRPAEALASLRTALELAPDHPQASAHLGRALMALGREDEALRHWRAALERAPYLIEVRVQLANALALGGEPRAALAEYRAALRADPGLAEVHNNLANTHFALGELDAAAAAYRRALELRPAYLFARFNLGRCLAAAGRLDEALVELRAASLLAPEDQRVLRALEETEERARRR